MARIHCPHCGTANQDVAESAPCWKCGKALNATPDPNAPPPQKATLDPSTYLLQPIQKEEKKRQNSTPIVAVAFVLLIVIVVLVYFMVKR
jgi:uncharacterized membrane protein YvbJ